MQWINLRLCGICPYNACQKVNVKIGHNNVIECQQCSKLFCYMCNKAIENK